MNNNLYIVESPTKSNKIKNLGLNSLYTLGHISELDVLNEDIYNINIKNLKIIPKKKNYAFIENEIKNYNGNIVIGTDPDPEGELIAFTIAKICEKYNKKFIRNPLYGVSNSEINDFVNLNNIQNININYIYYGISRILFDSILYKAIKKVINKKFNSNINLGRIQHNILLILDNFKNYYRYNINNYYFLSKEELEIDNYKKKENFKLLNVNTPYNTGSFILDGLLLGNTLFNNKINTNTLCNYLQKLYIKGYITYPRTNGISLEEDSYKLIYLKSIKSKLPVSNIFYKGEYEKGISPLKLISKLNGDLDKSFKLILKRTIAYLIKPYIVNSYIFNLKTKKNRSFNIELLYDNKKIISNIYMPEYLISDLEDMELYSLGTGLDEYQIIKLLYKTNMGRPSTYGYLIDNLIKKELIKETNIEEIILTGLGTDIVKLLKNELDFLTLEFYQNISNDFSNIKLGIQNYIFPIEKLLLELNKKNINIGKIDLNNIDNNIELEYKKLWITENNNEDYLFKTKI